MHMRETFPSRPWRGFLWAWSISLRTHLCPSHLLVERPRHRRSVRWGLEGLPDGRLLPALQPLAPLCPCWQVGCDPTVWHRGNWSPGGPPGGGMGGLWSHPLFLGGVVQTPVPSTRGAEGKAWRKLGSQSDHRLTCCRAVNPFLTNKVNRAHPECPVGGAGG